MEEYSIRTAIDVGANVGWFSAKLAEAGVSVIAVEQEPKFFRPLLFVRKKLDRNNPSVFISEIDERTVCLLPTVDSVFFLAVWHHLVRYKGLCEASQILRELWNRCRFTMFFETGEKEIPQSWGLPDYEEDADSFVYKYLVEQCPGGDVRNLGRHEAFFHDEVCKRTLWVVARK